jgi:hypothetical protein
MRPKASLEYLHIAAAFAQAVTVQSDEIRECEVQAMVHCKGQKSIFAALSQSIPGITRKSNKHRDSAECCLKGAISEAELNKFLSRLGYQIYRHRKRMYDPEKKLNFTEVRVWSLMRWTDPSNQGEMERMRSHLSGIQDRFPGHYIIFENKLIEFLESMFLSDRSNRNNYPQGELLEEDDLWTHIPLKPSEIFDTDFNCGESNPPGCTATAAGNNQSADSMALMTREHPVKLSGFDTAIPYQRLTSNFR